MPMLGWTTCAVPDCNGPIHGFNNLCDDHRLPGSIMQISKDNRTARIFGWSALEDKCGAIIRTDPDSTMIITIWAAEHAGEFGIILCNDWALGDYFGGRAGFEAKLTQQGFTNARHLETPEEVETAKAATNANWGGPWLPKYPWEKNAVEAVN